MAPGAVCLISMSLEFVPEANGSDVSGMPSIAVEIQKQTTIKFLPGARCGGPMTTVRKNYAKIDCELVKKHLSPLTQKFWGLLYVLT